MAYPLNTLVAGLATLDSQDPVLQYGIDLVEELGSTLHVVLAFPSPSELASLGAGPGLFDVPPVVDPSQALEIETRLLEDLQALVKERSSNPRIECHVIADAPHAALTQTVSSVGADVLLVGATRKGRLGRTLLGTTAGRVMRSANVPVLVLREPPPRAGARVLLATDLTELSAKAYQVGIAVAEALFGAEPLELRSLVVAGGTYGFGLPSIDLDQRRATAAANHRRFLDLNGGRSVPDRVRIGAPADEIVSEATEWPADVVILGTHGRSGLSRTFLGSVAESVLRNLPCDALVIPAAMFAEPGPGRQQL
jgi:nucleotide-binding universal stress UspA family protein